MSTHTGPRKPRPSRSRFPLLRGSGRPSEHTNDEAPTPTPGPESGAEPAKTPDASGAPCGARGDDELAHLREARSSRTSREALERFTAELTRKGPLEEYTGALGTVREYVVGVLYAARKVDLAVEEVVPVLRRRLGELADAVTVAQGALEALARRWGLGEVDPHPPIPTEGPQSHPGPDTERPEEDEEE
ncbi:MAG: hypothetical protein M0010_07850 [Actinomycetota bacterium]|nr:hypothetical protein [Actinomycetota bacterium]